MPAMHRSLRRADTAPHPRAHQPGRQEGLDAEDGLSQHRMSDLGFGGLGHGNSFNQDHMGEAGLGDLDGLDTLSALGAFDFGDSGFDFGDTAPDVEDRAEKLTSSIARSEAIFDQERHESSPYAESYLEKHRRHQRNKKNKAMLKAFYLDPSLWEHLEGAERKETKAEARAMYEDAYAKKKDREPESLRRQHNRDLKARLKEEVAANPDLEGDEEAQKLEVKKAYLSGKLHFGGEDKHTKALAKVEEIEIQQRNAELSRNLSRQFAIESRDPPRVRALKMTRMEMQFDRLRERTPKEQAKEEKAQQDEEALAEETRRKEENARLKEEIYAKHTDRKGRLDKKNADREYASKKKLTAKDAQKRQDKQIRRFADEMNAELKTSANERHSDDPKQAKRLRATHMMVVDEDTRKARNKMLKSAVSKREYRALKTQRDEVDGYEKSTLVDTACLVTSALNTLSAGGTYAVSAGVERFGSDDSKDLVNGVKLELDDDTSLRMGGTANQSVALLGALGGVTTMVGKGNKLSNAVRKREDEDPSNREAAKVEIVQSVSGIADGGVKTTAGVLKAIQTFTTDPALAETMKLDALPIVGIIGNVMKFAEASIKLGDAAVRAGKTMALKKTAKNNHDVGLAAALKAVHDADLEVVAGKTMDLLMISSRVVSDGLTLSGVGAPVAAGLKTANTIIGLGRTAATALYESEKARYAKGEQIKYHDALDNHADSETMLKRGKKLITSNTRYAVQEVINGARDGDDTALDYLSLFNLDTKDFSRMKDSHIRSMILSRIEAAPEPETLLDKLHAIPNQLRAVKRALK